MVRMSMCCKKALVLVGGLLLVPLGLLVLMVFAVIARPLFVIAMVVAVVAAVVTAFNPRFRRWLDTKLDEQVQYKGLRLACNSALHSSHSWACMLPRGVLVGADDLVQAALGPVERVDLPAIGQRVEQGDPLFVLRRGDRSLEVRAPITGTVLARNELLSERPGAVNEDPFREGWVVRLRADNVAEGKEARAGEGKHAAGSRAKSTGLWPASMARSTPK